MTSFLRSAPALIVAFALAFAVPAPASADSHLEASSQFIRDLADRAIDTLTADDLQPEERRDRFRALFREAFAIDGIARFVLGRYWRQATSEQREEYLALFEDVTVNTWAGRFSEYSGQRFDVGSARDAASANTSENVAIVNSTFFIDATTPVRIDWRVASRGDLFKITDIAVEGASMATTQRDEFLAVIRSNRGDVSALLDVLRERRDRAGS